MFTLANVLMYMKLQKIEYKMKYSTNGPIKDGNKPA